MSVFPAGFNPRDDVLGVLDLVNINTPDGDFGFLIGTDGKYIDINGKEWWGSVLIGSPSLPFSVNGIAPAGEIGMTFFQDPEQNDLVADIRSLGADYVRGRALSFYSVFLTDMNQIYAPTSPPVLISTVKMQSIVTEASGPLQRRISVVYEGAFAGRNEARGLIYNTSDHAKLIGSQNPSLTYIPAEYRPEEKLF